MAAQHCQLGEIAVCGFLGKNNYLGKFEGAQLPGLSGCGTGMGLDG